jgi:copper chaperone
MTTLTYNVPNVNCGHCKMMIERKVGELSGVASISVNVDTKQAVIKFGAPATEAEIESLLAEIGYPPESQ